VRLAAGSSGAAGTSACFPLFREAGGVGFTPFGFSEFLGGALVLGLSLRFGDFFGFFCLFFLQRALHVGRSYMF